MSERRVGLVAAVLLLVAGVASAPAQERAELKERLLAVAQMSAKTRANLSAFDDSLARARRTMELVVVGPFHLRVEPGLEDLARRAADIANRQLQPLAGAALEHVSRREMVVRTETVRFGFPRETVRSVVVAILDSTGVERMPLWGPIEHADLLASWLRQEALLVLVWSLDPAMHQWLAGAPAVFDTVAQGSWMQLRLQLVSSPATIARRCYAEDYGACAKVLGLVPTADPVLEWFDAPARRALVTREQRVSYRRAGVALTDRCLGGNDRACIDVLETGELSFYTYLPGHRVSLMQHAIQLGGAGALERLFTPNRSAAEHLADAARMPVDAIVRSWLGRVRGTRGTSEDLTAGLGLMSLAWIGIFGALGLRSTRWR